MKMQRLQILIELLLIVCKPRFVNLQLTCPAAPNNVTSFLSKDIGVSSGILWEAKSFCLRECARFCVSRKECSSFTYHTKTTVCSLSRDTVDSGKVVKGPFLVYSEFQWIYPEVIAYFNT